jgi:integrase
VFLAAPPGVLAVGFGEFSLACSVDQLFGAVGVE